MKIAIISNDKVANIIESDTVPDVGIICDSSVQKGYPVVDGEIIGRPSEWHTLNNLTWEITPENQILKDEEESESARLTGIKTERESAGLKKITIAQAIEKIDQIFADKTTVAQVRSATILALKKMMPYILK